MAEKRRDNKNRVLRTGESQRKDGRYMYKYTDIDGKVKYEYSWKLVATDKMPAGKKDEPCLRDKVKEVEKRIEKGLDTRGLRMTVLELVEETLAVQKVKESTMKLYRRTVRKHIQDDEIAALRIVSIRRKNVKEFTERLEDKKLSKSTASIVVSILYGAFKYAVNEELLSRNPFVGAMVGYSGEPATRKVEALTQAQKESFMRSVRSNTCTRKYADEIELLFETGMRIGELSGLTSGEIDQTMRVIHVKQQLHFDGGLRSPKSKSGVRDIPIGDEAMECLKRILKRPENRIVDIHGDSLLIKNLRGTPISSALWRSRFITMSNNWMKDDPDNARKVTPHMCRHTFCSELIRKGANPKVVQYLMGHSQLSTTMDTYAGNDNVESAFEEMKRLKVVSV